MSSKSSIMNLNDCLSKMCTAYTLTDWSYGYEWRSAKGSPKWFRSINLCHCCPECQMWQVYSLIYARSWHAFTDQPIYSLVTTAFGRIIAQKPCKTYVTSSLPTSGYLGNVRSIISGTGHISIHRDWHLADSSLRAAHSGRHGDTKRRRRGP